MIKKTLFASPVITIFFILLAAVALTYVVPSGVMEREINPITGLEMVDSSTISIVEKDYLGFMEVFGAIYQGFINASDIIFLCFFSSFYIRVLTDSGSFNGAIGALIRRVGNNKKLIIPIFIILISLTGFSYGETEDLYPLIPMFISTSILVGYDEIVGIAISGGAVVIGFAASAFNPYTVGVAQGIAELPLFSGALYRTIIYFVLITLYIWWVMRYAKKISNNTVRLKMGNDSETDSDDSHIIVQSNQFTTRQKIIVWGLFTIVLLMIYGAMNLGWYFKEIASLFLAGGLISAVIAGYGSLEIVEKVTEGFKDIMLGVVVIGLARSIMVVLDEALIIDTIIFALYNALSVIPNILQPVGMLIIQMFINLFIPSGSGQAAAIMPIMIPLADLSNVNRQIAVLAFQMGDGFSNLIWPTGAIAVICGIGKVPLDRWYKFFLPFFAIMVLLQMFFLIMASIIDYGPF